MQAALITNQRRFGIGFLAGLLAGIAASLLMLIFSMLLGSISLPEVLGAKITESMPPSVFQSLHELIGADAKRYLFIIILLGQILIFALSGGLCNLIATSARFTRSSDAEGRLQPSVGLWLAVLLWLFTGFVFLPLTGASLFGASLSTGILNTMFSLAAVGVIFGLLFVFVQNWLTLRRLQSRGAIEEKVVREAKQTRRKVLGQGVLWLGVAAIGTVAWRFISNGLGSGGGQSLGGDSVQRIAQHFQSKITPPPTPNYGEIQAVKGLSSEITSSQGFYTVSKNLAADPTVDASGWNLTISGQVEQPYKLTYNDLLAMPMKTQYETLMCISNEVGGPYMGNAMWEGIPLADLLQRAGKIKPGATKVVLYAVDDYSDSIHLSKALEPTTLVALRMNGETLPQNHGFPARLLVPGIYGMKHVKWITRIEVVTTDYLGYWQKSGWSDPAPVRMTTRIDIPHIDITLTANKPTYVAGVAFSGNKGISQVDVSFDAGQSWQHAVLKRPLSDFTWVLWELPWTPRPGTYTIVARAVDMEGNVQNPTQASPAPDGSSGYHSIEISVA